MTDVQVATLAISGTLVLSGFTSVVVEVVKQKFITPSSNGSNGHMTWRQHTEYCNEKTEGIYNEIGKVNSKLDTVIIGHTELRAKLEG